MKINTNLKKLSFTNYKNNKQIYSYIIYGQYGIGKTYLSNKIAKYILTNENRNNFQKVYSKFVDLNLIFNSTGNNKFFLSVDIIRNIKSWLNYTILNGKYKVIVIDDIDTMSVSSQNAFLKVLEDFIGNTVYILNTSSIKLISSTIKSRCFKLKLKKISLKYFANILFKLCKKEYKNNLEMLYEICNGDINLALELIKNDKLNVLISLYIKKKYSKIISIIEQINLDIKINLRLFKYLISKLIIIFLEKSFENKKVILLFYSIFQKIQYILINIELLNKKYSQQVVVNSLNTLLLTITSVKI